MVEDADDDYDYEDDVNALDEDDYEETWYEEDGEDVDDDDYDEDQVALVDDEGWFYVDETTNAVYEQLCGGDDEFAATLTTYTEARGALAKARIARGFYLVVVLADAGTQARFGRKGSGK